MGTTQISAVIHKILTVLHPIMPKHVDIRVGGSKLNDNGVSTLKYACSE